MKKLQDSDPSNFSVETKQSNKDNSIVEQSDMFSDYEDEDEETDINFDSIEDIVAFLKPANDAVQSVVKEVALNHPEVLHQLAAINFNDLLTVFKHLFYNSDSIEQAYKKLFTGVKQKGAKQFLDEIKLIVKAGSENPDEDNQNDILNNVVSNYLKDHKV